MSIVLSSAVRPGRRRERCAAAWPRTIALVLCGAGSTLAAAQAPAPPAASASSAELTAAERARRDADKVFERIRMHADQPRRGSAERAAGAAGGRPAVKPAAPRREAEAAGAAEPSVPSPATPAVDTAAPQGGSDSVPVEVPLEVTGSNLNSGTRAPEAGSRAPDAATASAAPVAPSAASALLPGDTMLARLREPGQATVSQVRGFEGPGQAPLRAVFQPEPQFGGAVMRQMRQGKVQVAFEVGTDGGIGRPEVLSSSHPRLNQAAIEAVSQWRFAPVDQPRRGVVTLGFNLDE
jgi:TonB family protein